MSRLNPRQKQLKLTNPSPSNTNTNSQHPYYILPNFNIKHIVKVANTNHEWDGVSEGV